MKSLQHEEGMVEASHRIPLVVVLHVLMEVPAILQLDTVRPWRQRVHIISRRYIHVKLIEVVQVLAIIHQPFRIAEHRYHDAWSIHYHTVQLGKGHVQLLRATGIQNDHITLAHRESLPELSLVGTQVGNAVLNAVLLQLPAQSRRKAALCTG